MPDGTTAPFRMVPVNRYSGTIGAIFSVTDRNKGVKFMEMFGAPQK